MPPAALDECFESGNCERQGASPRFFSRNRRLAACRSQRIACQVQCLYIAGLLSVAIVFANATVAESRWPDERSAGPFLCHADFSLANYTHLLQELDQLQRDLVRALGTQPPREPIHLFLFSRKSEYEKYLGQHFPNVPARRALYIKERGPGMVFAYRSGDFEVDVRHEGTHALLHADLTLVPLWLDEGLAEYFEARYDERTFEHPHLAEMKWQLSKINLAAKLKSTPSLEKLEELHDLKQMGANEYRQSWAWVHFMLHGSPEAQEELTRFLADIRAQTPPGKLSERLRRRIPNLEQKFTEHLRQWNR
jgi:hypothetical protein